MDQQSNKNKGLYARLLAKKNKKRRGLIVFAILFFLLTIFFLIAHLAQPAIQHLAEATLSKTGFKSQKTELSILGKIDLKNLSFPQKKGTITIESLSGRLPLPFIAGNLTLKNVSYSEDSFTITMPEVFLKGIRFDKQSVGLYALMNGKIDTLLKHINIHTGLIPLAVIEDNPPYTAETNATFKNIRLDHYTPLSLANFQIQQITITGRAKFEPAPQINLKNISLSGFNFELLKALKSGKSPNLSLLNSLPSLSLFEEFSIEELNVVDLKDYPTDLDLLKLTSFRLKGPVFVNETEHIQKFFADFKKIKLNPANKRYLSYRLANLVSYFNMAIGRLELTLNDPPCVLRLNGLEVEKNLLNGYSNLKGLFLKRAKPDRLFDSQLENLVPNPLQLSWEQSLTYNENDKTEFIDASFDIKDLFTLNMQIQATDLPNLKERTSLLESNKPLDARFKGISIYYTENGILDRIKEGLVQFGVVTSIAQADEFLDQLRKSEIFASIDNKDLANTLDQLMEKLLQNNKSFLLRITAKGDYIPSIVELETGKISPQNFINSYDFSIE